MSAPSPTPARCVAVLVKRFPKLSETFVLEEVLGMERLGVPLRIYTLAPPSDGLVHPAVAQVRAPVVQVPPTPLRQPLRFASRHLREAATAPWRYLRALGKAVVRGRAGWHDFARAGWLAGQLRADGAAHLHSHFISTPADVAELVSAMSGLPFSISAHAKDIYLSRPDDLNRKLHAASFTVSCTEFNCRVLRRVAPTATVQRMYHGIDAAAFHPSRRAVPSLVPLILSVGRLVEKKGLDTLVEACRLLAGRGVPFRCEIVGYGEQHERLATLIEHHGLQAQVQLTGKLTREQVIDRYARAAVYVQPSRVAADGDRDGIPNVLLEAMAMGLPVVATRISGIPELVKHRHNGLLVGAEDASNLADAVQQLIETPVLAAQLGRQARQAVTRDFDNDRNLRVLLGLLAAAHAHEPQPQAA